MHHKEQAESVRWSLDGHVYLHCRASQRDALAFAVKPARRDQVLPQDLLFLGLKLGVG